MALDIVELALGGGVIGMGPVPGRGGTYEADFATLVRWSPDVVVSLTEAFELNRFGAACMAEELRDMGISWLHFPIGDFGVPDQSVGQYDLEDRLLTELQNGARLYIHCRAGCGRTGMLVLRLMIALGEEAGAALRRLRGVRRCAVETEAQFDWAKGP